MQSCQIDQPFKSCIYALNQGQFPSILEFLDRESGKLISGIRYIFEALCVNYLVRSRVLPRNRLCRLPVFKVSRTKSEENWGARRNVHVLERDWNLYGCEKYWYTVAPLYHPLTRELKLSPLTQSLRSLQHRLSSQHQKFSPSTVSIFVVGKSSEG